MREEQSRRIADDQHNAFLQTNGRRPQPTAVAPASLLQPLSREARETVAARQELVEGALAAVAGAPFYRAPGFILYQGDCVPLLSALHGQSITFDLTVTSPPYNIGKEYESARPLEEYLAWCRHWSSLIAAVSKPDGAFWLNLGYLEVPGQGRCVPIPYLLWDQIPFYLLQEVVWTYGAGVSARRRLAPRNEKWLFYVRNPQQYTFDLDAIRDPNVKYPHQKKGSRFRCHPLGKNPTDVWELPKVTTGSRRRSRERTDHPAQFPLPLVERIVRVSSRLGEVVLDPFAGSCSTGLAASGLGRIFVGCELSPEYCQLAAERFERFQAARCEAV